jgi:RNA polymerase sigma-B factor
VRVSRERPSSERPSAAQPPDRELFARVHAGDGRARELLVERYLPLARRLARRYQRSEEPQEDLVQVASLGLLKAIDRYDAEREVAFSSFAVPTILGELRRHFRDRTWSVRVPRELQELALRVDRVAAELSIQRGRAPTVAEIAHKMDVTEEQVLDALQAAGAYRAGSLDAPRSGSGDDAPGESLAEAIGVQEGGYQRAEERATLAPMFAHVSPRERLVLTLRFAQDMTQAEIGERIGVSQMQVSRLIRHALARLREGLRDAPREGSPREDPPTG